MLTLQEKRKECNEKHQENRDDTTSDPVKCRLEVIATTLPRDWISASIHFTNSQLFVKSAKENH